MPARAREAARSLSGGRDPRRCPRRRATPAVPRIPVLVFTLAPLPANPAMLHGRSRRPTWRHHARTCYRGSPDSVPLDPLSRPRPSWGAGSGGRAGARRSSARIASSTAWLTCRCRASAPQSVSAGARRITRSSRSVSAGHGMLHGGTGDGSAGKRRRFAARRWAAQRTQRCARIEIGRPHSGQYRGSDAYVLDTEYPSTDPHASRPMPDRR